MGYCPRWLMEHIGGCNPRAVAWVLQKIIINFLIIYIPKSIQNKSIPMFCLEQYQF